MPSGKWRTVDGVTITDAMIDTLSILTRCTYVHPLTGSGMIALPHQCLMGLVRRGLATSRRPGRGLPCEWTITARGREVLAAAMRRREVVRDLDYREATP
jgi:hypothetical protein